MPTELSGPVAAAQTKRVAASDADLLSDSEADHAGDRSPQLLSDHGTAQPARQSRDHFKRAKADSGVAPECYVAALSLKNNDGDATANIEQKQLQQQLRRSEVLLRRGKHDEALRLLENIIVSDPVNAEALHLRGQCFVAKNNSVGAFASFAAAVAVQPSHAHALVACAVLYRASGQLARAVAALETAAAAAPNDAAVQQAYAAGLNATATQLKSAGQRKAALVKYQQAVDICPTYADGFYDLGVYYSEDSQFDKAAEEYKRCLQLKPHFAEAHCNLGVIHHLLGRLDEALAAHQQAYRYAPGLKLVQEHLAMAYSDKATQIKEQGDTAAAIGLYEQALALNPGYVRAIYNLGVAHAECGQHDKAIFMYNMAVALDPTCAEAYNNLAVVMREAGNLEAAVQACQAALQIRPVFPQCLNNLATLYTSQGRAFEALHLLQAALLAWPNYAEAHNNLGVLQRDMGSIPEALASYETCLKLDANNRNAGQNRLLALNYIYDGADPMVCEAHAAWGDHFQQQFMPLPPLQHADRLADSAADLATSSADGTPAEVAAAVAGDSLAADSACASSAPLVVGYISPDLFTHSVSYFAEAPLRHHHSSRVKHVVYNCSPRGDSKTQMLKGATEAAGGVWREAAKLSEQDLAALVREDGVQLLVELTGQTANNRLGVMALQPAPLQLTWIGYPNSTGLKAVHYRLTDALCDPANTEQTFVEELIRLPGCFLCYTPATDAPEVAPLPALLNGFVTFGSFNNMAKITPEVIEAWVKILQAVPSSRFLLKNKPFACPAAREHVLQLFVKKGIAAHRIDLLPLAAANADHLATYGDVDISLDTFPYAGTTTTCESLYMGVPCVTLAGACHAHNVGVSLLSTIGINNKWVATDQCEYMDKAVQAASNVVALSKLRQNLRQQVLDSPLCDAGTFVSGLETCYSQLWKRYTMQQKSMSMNTPTNKSK
ncbi:hypothetical protein ABBQ38_004018 [Trebouxia sp. C0009 RCD-2024]